MKKNILFVILIIAVLALASCTETASQEQDLANSNAEQVENEATSQATDKEDTAKENDAANAADSTGEANVIHVTDADFHDVVDNSEGVVIVDFWASWCRPCVMLGPILEEVSAEEGVILYKVNVDDNPALSSEFKIGGIPMVYIYKDGEMVDSQLGLAEKETYVNLVNIYK